MGLRGEVRVLHGGGSWFALQEGGLTWHLLGRLGHWFSRRHHKVTAHGAGDNLSLCVLGIAHGLRVMVPIAPLGSLTPDFGLNLSDDTEVCFSPY